MAVWIFTLKVQTANSPSAKYVGELAAWRTAFMPAATPRQLVVHETLVGTLGVAGNGVLVVMP